MLKPTPRCRRRKRKRARGYLICKYLRGEMILTPELSRFINQSSFWKKVWAQAIFLRMTDPVKARKVGIWLPNTRQKVRDDPDCKIMKGFYMYYLVHRIKNPDDSY